jgi:hypothetical protein
MTTGSANTHANHDETLIVRLYGGDVDPQERVRALDLLADCSACAGLFADLGQIASATAALRVPSRPRDFSITSQDAARLRPAKQARGGTSWRGLTRRMGGAFAALGIAGILVTGAATALAPAAGVTQQLASNTRDEAALQVGAAGVPTASGAGYAAVSPASSNGTKAVAASPSPVQNDLGSIPIGSMAPGLGPSAAPVEPPHSTSGATTLAVAAEPATIGQSNSVGGQGRAPGPPPSGGSVDARLALVIGSAGLLLIGLLLLASPRLRGRGLRG